jgi:hypothetical protein
VAVKRESNGNKMAHSAAAANANSVSPRHRNHLTRRRLNALVGFAMHHSLEVN